MEGSNWLSLLLCCHGNQSKVTFSLNLQFSRNIVLIIRGRKTRNTPFEMLNNTCTIEWKIEIGCHGCSVAMVTSQKSTRV